MLRFQIIQKVAVLTIFIKLQQNLRKVWRSAVNAGHYLAICQILKVCGTLKTSHLGYIYIANSHKPILIPFGKRANRTSRSQGLLFNAMLRNPGASGHTVYRYVTLICSDRNILSEYMKIFLYQYSSTLNPMSKLLMKILILSRWLTRACFSISFTFPTFSLIPCVCVCLDAWLSVGRQESDEEKLMKYLFEGYNPAARPVMNSSDTVLVKLIFCLMHIKDLVGWRGMFLWHCFQTLTDSNAYVSRKSF